MSIRHPFIKAESVTECFRSRIKHPQNRDGMNTQFVIECSNCVVEKTVRRAGRAWHISLGEM